MNPNYIERTSHMLYIFDLLTKYRSIEDLYKRDILDYVDGNPDMLRRANDCLFYILFESFITDNEIIDAFNKSKEEYKRITGKDAKPLSAFNRFKNLFFMNGSEVYYLVMETTELKSGVYNDIFPEYSRNLLIFDSVTKNLDSDLVPSFFHYYIDKPHVVCVKTVLSLDHSSEDRKVLPDSLSSKELINYFMRLYAIFGESLFFTVNLVREFESWIVGRGYRTFK